MIETFIRGNVFLGTVKNKDTISMISKFIGTEWLLFIINEKR